ncbi:hypothetical protein J1605_015790 [Eschrichtius robustus]|uniref:FAM50A/XAP5 C-terminal domain-containing protein n=1 Tax=Eschrichtius robustus TaxID=9764 RepID=A0AB34G8P7_ESCRO|nr:hypothetical protein J1605_015790 [Eschrichtius robustus]
MAQYKGAASEAGRAMHLMKKREKQREQMEQMKQRIAEENIMKSNIDKKFSAHYDAVEAELKSSTVGLVTLNDMKAKQEALVKEREKQLAKKEQSKELQLWVASSQPAASPSGRGAGLVLGGGSGWKLEKLREKERKKEAKRKISSLSFTLEEEDEAGEEEEEATIDEEELEREEITAKKRKLGKNPDVDTSFLPDRDREEEENRLREELRQEWEAKQEKIKSEGSWSGMHVARGWEPRPLSCQRCSGQCPEPQGAGREWGHRGLEAKRQFCFVGEEIEITFSYWDGSGHRRTVKMKKGNTMQQFLQKALEILRKDFSELRSAGVEQLMYIKEDLIIPHHHSFYDFIVTKARGKSGPLFNFDVHDDVRLLSDATVEKDESHAGKVVLRSWYEKNKHIFPASRWEPYDPEKKWDKYTVQKPSSAEWELAWLPGRRPARPCSARFSFSVPWSCTRSGDGATARPQLLRLPAAPSLRPQDSGRPAPRSQDVTGPAQPLPLALLFTAFFFYDKEIHASELEHLFISPRSGHGKAAVGACTHGLPTPPTASSAQAALGLVAVAAPSGGTWLGGACSCFLPRLGGQLPWFPWARLREAEEGTLGRGSSGLRQPPPALFEKPPEEEASSGDGAPQPAHPGLDDLREPPLARQLLENKPLEAQILGPVREGAGF